jgi:alpha-1,2-glucosyltransferase
MSLVLHSGILEVYFEPRRSMLSTTSVAPYWRSHQFLLEGKKLMYLGTESKVQRSIELNHMCSAKNTTLDKDQLGRNFCFMVYLGFVGPGNKLIMNARDDEERQHWINVINAVCNNKPVTENVQRARDSISQRSPSTADESLSPVGKSSSKSELSPSAPKAASTPEVSEKKRVSMKPAKPESVVENVVENTKKVSSEVKRQSFGAAGYMILSVLFSLGALVLQNQFTGIEAYMDELFHIPQAQRYCEGKFYPDEWDSKITTFPGVYYLSYMLKTGWELTVAAGREALVVVKQEKEEPASYWLYDSTPAPSKDLGVDMCSMLALRAQSVVLGGLIFFVSFQARGALIACRGGSAEGKGASVLMALVATLYPVSAFYYFLFYTDTASTLFLVLALWVAGTAPAGGLAKVANLAISAGAAATAISMRQTNVVWVVFIAGSALIPSDRGSIGSYLHNLFFGGVTFAHLKAGALLVPVGAFVHFVVNMNEGSIVLGDKTNHVPAFHWAMPMHALAVLSVLLILIKPPCAPSTGKTVINTPSALRVAGHAFGVAGVTAALVYGSLPHPFLLSDNRHYTFYLWQRFLSEDKVRVAMGPAYYYLIQRGVCILRKANGLVWVLGFLLAVALSLVPAPLLEPRYFTPTIVVGLLGAPQATQTYGTSYTLRLSAVVALFLALNAVTVYVFSSMPFTGASGEVARFMY